MTSGLCQPCSLTTVSANLRGLQSTLKWNKNSGALIGAWKKTKDVTVNFALSWQQMYHNVNVYIWCIHMIGLPCNFFSQQWKQKDVRTTVTISPCTLILYVLLSYRDLVVNKGSECCKGGKGEPSHTVCNLVDTPASIKAYLSFFYITVTNIAPQTCYRDIILLWEFHIVTSLTQTCKRCFWERWKQSQEVKCMQLHHVV